MITSLLIKDVASYDANDGVEIDDLKKVNFFFGFNGTGKSTIAKYLRSLEPNVQQSKFNACNNVGYNSSNYEILTFNKDFIIGWFIQFLSSNQQQGIKCPLLVTAASIVPAIHLGFIFTGVVSTDFQGFHSSFLFFFICFSIFYQRRLDMAHLSSNGQRRAELNPTFYNSI